VPGTGAARAQCGKLFHPARLACPATALRRDQDRPGAKAPGQRPPRPRRALASVLSGPTGLGGTVPSGRGKRGSRFPFPPALMTAPSPPRWQGPSPLPWHHAGIRTGRGPKPPASARPAPGGRFAPAGSGAGLCPSWNWRSTGNRPARAGKRDPRFRVPSEGAIPCPRPGRTPRRQAVGLLFQQPVRVLPVKAGTGL